MKTIQIKTELFGKDDVFRVLGVSHATGYPSLLVGPAGTGKTKAILDYSKALSYDDKLNPQENWAKIMQEAFILEADEGTRSNEVKGRIDVKKLLEDGTYQMNSPITKAKFILINEVDKASPGLRNAFLGVMNERVLFNGMEKIRCDWELFCGSCNILNTDVAEIPFWDRFVFTYDVSRVGAGQLLKYFTRKKSHKVIKLNIPSPKEVNEIAAQIPVDKLKKFMDVGYDSITDRTASYVPRIIAAVSVVYDLALGRAMMKSMELLLDANKSKALSKIIEPPEFATIRSQIEIIMTLQDYDQVVDMVENVKQSCISAGKKGILAQSDLEELQVELNTALLNNHTYTEQAAAKTTTTSDPYQGDVQDAEVIEDTGNKTLSDLSEQIGYGDMELQLESTVPSSKRATDKDSSPKNPVNRIAKATKK